MSDKNLSEIKKVLPEAAENETVKSLAESLDNIQEVAAIMNTERGQALTRLLVENATVEMRNLISSYKEASKEDFVASFAAIDANLTLASTLKNAPEGAKAVQQELDKLIRDVVEGY